MVGWGGAGNPSSAQETVRGAHRWVGGGRCPEGVASFTTRDSGPGSQTPDVPRQTLRDLEALRLTHTCQAHPAWGMAQGQEGARPRPTRPLSGHRPLLGTQPWLLPPRFRGPRRVAGRPGVESLLCEFGLPPPHHPICEPLLYLLHAGRGTGSLVDAYSWSPELDGRLRPWLSAFPPCLPDPDPGLGRGAAAWDVDVGRTRSGEVSSFPSGLCDRKEETEAYLSASCMLTPGSNHPGVPPIPCCWGWRGWGRLREQGGGTGSTARPAEASRPGVSAFPGLGQRPLPGPSQPSAGC